MNTTSVPGVRRRLGRAPWWQSVLTAAGVFLIAVAGCKAREPVVGIASRTEAPCLSDQRVTLASATITYDLYLPASNSPAPLVVVAHGFGRSKANMAGWGRRLAEEGFIAVVPSLPGWSDHRRNGAALNQLATWISHQSPYKERIRQDRIGMMGFSAGGLSTLLAAADNPDVGVWVGLDPVDRNRLGANTATRLNARAIILFAEPSACNAQGNGAGIEQALGSRCHSVRIAGARHTDAEWPTDPMAELVCGRSHEHQRERFAAEAVAALRESLR